MPKVSIIVPVYNTELFIRECLDSIRQQTFTDWECLLIDDGSIDNSGKICDEYVLADSRFSVFHVLNGGVSRARNIGLRNMLGEWVTFVDSDDALAKNAIGVCVMQAEKHSLDLLQFSLTRNKDFLNINDGEKTDVLNLYEYVNSQKLQICAGGSFYKASIVKNNNLFFKPHVKLAEDQLFVFNFVNKTKKIKKLDECLYWYRENPNSATNNSKSIDMICSVKTLAKFKKLNPIWNSYIDRINVLFLIKIIYNNDVNFCLMKKIIREANLSNIQMVARGLPILFCIVGMFSRTLAILLVKFRCLFRDSHA